MKGNIPLAASLACFLIVPAWGQSDPAVQLISPNRGLIEAPATVPKDSTAVTVTIPSANQTSDPVTKKISDPDNLIPEANKISSQLPGKVLAERERDGYRTSTLGPESVNEFLYISQQIVSNSIAAREDYKKVAVAFEESQVAFNKARAAFGDGGPHQLAAFNEARTGLMDKLLDTLMLIERLYGEVREKKNRSTDDKYTQDHFVRLADKIRSDVSKLSNMGATAGENRAGLVDKAIYGFDDNVDVFHIDQIFRNARAIAMIRDRNDPGTPIGTAFLVAKNTLVTAEHCVMDHRDKGNMEDLEFVFFNEFILNADGSARILNQEIVCTFKGSIVYGKDADVSESFSSPDYAVLEISPPEPTRATIEAIRPLKISLRRSHYGDALCGIGHPGGRQKQVHLNCRVLLPFELKGREAKNRYATKMAAKIGAMDKAFNRDTRTNSTQSDREQKFLGRHYTVPVGMPENDSIYHVDHTNGLKRPAIGIEADTFAGDSGGPIIDIKTNAVIGILVAGQPDSNEAIEAVSLDQHEVVLPIQFVVDGMGGIEKVRTLGGTVLAPSP